MSPILIVSAAAGVVATAANAVATAQVLAANEKKRIDANPPCCPGVIRRRYRFSAKPMPVQAAEPSGSVNSARDDARSPLQLVQGDRQVAHALAGGMIDRIGDCRRNADDPDLAKPLDAER